MDPIAVLFYALLGLFAFIVVAVICMATGPRQHGYNPPPVQNVKRPTPTPAPPQRRYD